jgi:parallel beta-helix repeat protein
LASRFHLLQFIAGLVLSVASITQVAAALAAGDTIITDTTLTADITNCMGEGLIIGADNITLDGAGHSIVGAEPMAVHHGVYLNNRTGVTIQNCIIEGFFEGIYLHSGSSNNIIQNNSLRNNTSSGIGLTSNSSYNQIFENDLSNNGNSGIHISANCVDNLVLSNRIAGNTVRGIFLMTSSDDNLVTNNTIANSQRGIQISDSSGNIFTDNVIYYNFNHGVWISSGSDNYFSNNYFITNGAHAHDAASNEWGMNQVGNYWDDFSENPGHPSEYSIDADSVDHWPVETLPPHLAPSASSESVAIH